MRGHRRTDDPRLQLRRRCPGCFRQRAPPRALMRFQLCHRVLREGQSSVAFPIERVAASCGAILRKTLGRTRPQPNEPAPPD